MAIKLSAPPTPDLLLAAFEKHADEMRGLAENQLLARVNFDAVNGVAIVLGAHPALLERRKEIRDNLSKFPIHYIDDLESIAQATLYVYMQSITAPSPESRIATLTDSAKVERKKLQADAAAAIARELMDPSALDNVPTGNGRLEIAQGLVGLCVAFRASWPKAKGHTAVTEEILTAATQLGVELLAALGREENPSTASDVLPIKALWLRAASLLYLAYEECRRAMAWLRWYEGDAADFAPALYGTRGPRPVQNSDVSTTDAPVTPPEPVTSDATASHGAAKSIG